MMTSDSKEILPILNNRGQHTSNFWESQYTIVPSFLGFCVNVDIGGATINVCMVSIFVS